MIALGRLASYSEELALEAIVPATLTQLVSLLSQENKYLRKAAVLVFRSVAKHSASLAQVVVDSKALESLVECMKESSDHPLQESAIWAIGHVAKHSEALASSVVSAGAVPILLQTSCETDVTLKRISLSALGDIARHSLELAELVFSEGHLLPMLIKGIDHEEAGVRRQASACISQMVKHSAGLAKAVIEAGLFPKLILCLKDLNEHVRKNACASIRETVRQNEDMAKEVAASGAIAGIVEYVNDVDGVSRIPGIMCLGYVATYDSTLASAVMISNSVPVLKSSLINEPEDCVKAATAWCLGELGRHTTELANRLAEADILRRLLAVFVHDSSSPDLRAKCKKSIKLVSARASLLPVLNALIPDAPPPILKLVLRRIAMLLADDPGGRKLFVQSGSLERIQKIACDPESKLHTHILEINKLFPEDLVNFYSPQYQEALLKRLDELPD